MSTTLLTRKRESTQAIHELSMVDDSKGATDAMAMIRELAEDHVRVSKTGRAVVDTAQEIDDEPTADLAIGRMTVSDKAAWMLRSHLD